MICWPMFLLSQVFIFLATFTLVSDLNNFFSLLYGVVNLTFRFVVFISKLEHCYDLIRDAALKIRNESAEAATVKER